MHLYEVPLLFALVGLVLYVVLGGADFGAGLWQLLAGPGERGEPIREHAHDAMAPVWEANHVWLIFVLVVVWTAYPVAFGSIASTLAIPLFAAAVGIIGRGAAYALRSGASGRRELQGIDLAFALSSLLAPFALGTVIGAIAAGRVPVGNAAGDAFTSWLNPTGIAIGVLAVVTAAYLAAVYLAADAVRLGNGEMERAFRARALAAGVVAGGVAIGALVVLHGNAHGLYRGLVSGDGRPALIVSLLAGVVTLALVARRRYEAARYTASLAVAAVIAGWALAQQPRFLEGLTVQQAAAPHDTLVAVIVAVVGGALILFPSLALLFTLTLRGRLGYGSGPPDAEGTLWLAEPAIADAGAPPPAPAGVGAGTAEPAGAGAPAGAGVGAPAGARAEAAGPGALDALRLSATGLLARTAGACFIAGFGLLTVADAGWAHAIGVAALLAFVVLGTRALLPID